MQSSPKKNLGYDDTPMIPGTRFRDGGDIELRWRAEAGMRRAFFCADDPKPIMAAIARLSPQSRQPLSR